MKNILAAFVITLAAIFPSIASSSPALIQVQTVAGCQTPNIMLNKARMSGSSLITGMTGQELVLAKEHISAKIGVAVDELDFDLIEIYTHPDPSVYILIRYKEGCAVGGGPLPVVMWDELLEAVQGTDV